MSSKARRWVGVGMARDEIGQLLGTSPHESQLRFDPDSPVADKRWPFDID